MGVKKGGKAKVPAKQAKPPAKPPVRGYVAFGLGFLFPGLGHLFLRSFVRAGVLGFCVIALFLMGVADHGALYVPQAGEPLTYLAAFGDIGIGPAYFLLRGSVAGNPDGATFEYGCTMILLAALLNYLVMLDAFDLAVGNRR